MPPNRSLRRPPDFRRRRGAAPVSDARLGHGAGRACIPRRVQQATGIPSCVGRLYHDGDKPPQSAACCCSARARAPPAGSRFGMQFRGALLRDVRRAAPAQLRSQASASLEQLRQSEDGWRFCLEAFVSAARAPSSGACRRWWTWWYASARRRSAVFAKSRHRTSPSPSGSRRRAPARGRREAELHQEQVCAAACGGEPRLPRSRGWRCSRCSSPPSPAGPSASTSSSASSRPSTTRSSSRRRRRDTTRRFAARVKDGPREQLLLPQVAEAWLPIRRGPPRVATPPSRERACLHTVALLASAWIPIGLIAQRAVAGRRCALSARAGPPRARGGVRGAAGGGDEAARAAGEDGAPLPPRHRRQPTGAESYGAGGEYSPSDHVYRPSRGPVAALALELLECWRPGCRRSAPPTAASSVLAARRRRPRPHLPLLLLCLASDGTETSNATLSHACTRTPGGCASRPPSPKAAAAAGGGAAAAADRHGAQVRPPGRLRL